LLTILVLGWSTALASVALIALFPAGWFAFATLFVLRFLFGAFQAGGFPGLARIIADWIPARQRGFAQGLNWTSSRLGGAVAPLLGLWLFELLNGWAVPFLLFAGLGLMWCAVFWPWFRNRPSDMPQVNAAELALIGPRPAAASSRAAPGLPWTRFLAARNVWALCLLYGCLGFSGNFITNWLPSYLETERHLSKWDTALVAALPLTFGIISCVLAGTLSDAINRWTGRRNLGRRLVGGVSLVCAALTIASSIWVEDLWLLALVFSLAFFFNDANMGPTWASCADVGEKYAGALSGAMNMTGSFFAAFAMTIAGWLFDLGLNDVVFIMFGASYALGAVCWLAVDVTKPIAGRA
jgi:sugar phosphate permease